MKNKEIVSLYEMLAGKDENGQPVMNLKGVKFSYFVARNVAKMKPEVESIIKAQEAHAGFTDYELERIELAKKHAKKDEKGEPVVKDKAFILDNQDAFNTEFAVLKEKYKVVIEGRENQLKEFSELLDKESDIELHKINIKDIPEDITNVQMLGIYPLIEE